jgi:hypothetical protein
MTDSPLVRYMVCAVCCGVGVLMILTGISNVKTKTASESAKRAAVLQALGKSTEIQGNMAVFMGVTRILIGIAAIIFGVVYIFVGPFLAN